MQVVVVSGDQNDDGFKASTKDMPWVALPFGADSAAIKQVIPCTGYPTPGVINAATGQAVDGMADVFQNCNESLFDDCLKKI